jgi:hypothetical protein
LNGVRQIAPEAVWCSTFDWCVDTPVERSEGDARFRASAMSDVEVLGGDRRAVKHCRGAAHDDELHPYTREPPKELPGVRVPWTWHLSRPRARRQSASRPVVAPVAKANAPKKVNLSNVFARQKVGIKQVDDRLWLTSFMTYDLGYFDEDSCRLEPIEDPFGSKVLPVSSK